MAKRLRDHRGWKVMPLHLEDGVYDFEIVDAQLGPEEDSREVTLAITAGPLQGHRLRTIMTWPYYGLGFTEAAPAPSELIGLRFHAHFNDRIVALIPETVNVYAG